MGNLARFCSQSGASISRMANKQDGDRFGQTVAAQVRAEIAAADESVASIARTTGINRETLDRWVKGERALSVPTLYRIAVALGVDPHTIIRRAEERFVASTPYDERSNIIEGRFGVGGPAEDLAEVASESISYDPEDTDDKYDA